MGTCILMLMAGFESSNYTKVLQVINRMTARYFLQEIASSA